MIAKNARHHQYLQQSSGSAIIELEKAFNALSSLYMDKKPGKGEYLEILLRSSRTIFTTNDVAFMWTETDAETVSDRLKKYTNVGKLIRLRRGIYAKDKNYDRFELATRIYTPAYISFETVLTRTGINFQLYNNIFVASYITREIAVGGQKISFIRMKDDVLSNIAGIEHANNIATATKERAFLDRIYISKDYHFDNLNNLNWDKIFGILPIYQNKRMNKKVQEYFHRFGRVADSATKRLCACKTLD